MSVGISIILPPGPLGGRQVSKSCAVYFIEQKSLEELFCEWVLLEYLDDDERHQREFELFNKRREIIINEAFKGLGLEFRIKCVIDFPDSFHSVHEVMRSSVPPLQRWWDDHCNHVNGFFTPGILPQTSLAFCGFDTMYQDYWPLIQYTFEFMLTYKRYEFCQRVGPSYFESMRSVFSRIRKMSNNHLAATRFDENFIAIKMELQQLSEQADNAPEAPVAIHVSPYVPAPAYKRPLRRFAYHVWSTTHWIVLHLFHRYKLNERLVREGPDCPVIGKQDAFEFWWITLGISHFKVTS